MNEAFFDKNSNIDDLNIIRLCQEICGHRIIEPRQNGKWIVFQVTVHEMTFSKFFGRVKKDLDKYKGKSIPVFYRDGKFGFLSQKEGV